MDMKSVLSLSVVVVASLMLSVGVASATSPPQVSMEVNGPHTYSEANGPIIYGVGVIFYTNESGSLTVLVNGNLDFQETAPAPGVTWNIMDLQLNTQYTIQCFISCNGQEGYAAETFYISSAGTLQIEDVQP